MKFAEGTNWDGTKRELTFVVDCRVRQIMKDFNLDEKTARKVFCDSLFRNLVINEMDNMIDYIINGFHD